MKLLRLTIPEEYRSLKDFDIKFVSELEYLALKWYNNPSATAANGMSDSLFSNVDSTSENSLIHLLSPEQIEPMCLVGVNGCGKSQLLETLADIFTLLEGSYIAKGTFHKRLTFLPKEWTLEYILHRDTGFQFVKIAKSARRKSPQFFLIQGDKEVLIENQEECRELLPTRIIGYTSGENETLSHHFYQISDRYAKRVADRAFKPEQEKEPIPEPHTLFLDYDSNAIIVIANYLFQPTETLTEFKTSLRLLDLRSFRIIIKFQEKGQRTIKTTPEIDATVERLQRCALLVRHIIPEQSCELDFIVNSATRQAFKREFGNAQQLFVELNQLRQLNLLRLSKEQRETNITSNSKNRQYDQPVVPVNLRAFYIDSMDWYVQSVNEPIEYHGMSDGEHQFLLVTGMLMLMNDDNTLFLLDEPETHFNPLWRAKFFTFLNNLGINRLPQIILTTHSPFIVSDCRGSNVYKFERQNSERNDESLVTFSPVGFETYASSFQYILRELYGMTYLIAEQAYEDFKEKVAKAESLEELQQLDGEFGESFEKQILYKKIAQKEQEGE